MIFELRDAFAFGEPDSKILFVGPVAQLDRANGYEPLGREFESLRAHHFPWPRELKLASRDPRIYAAINGRSSTVRLFGAICFGK